MSTTTWKMEKKLLHGLESWVITNTNGAMRHASVEEVDMWSRITTLETEKTDLLQRLNKFGYTIENILKSALGRGIVDPDKIKHDADKAKLEADKAKAKEAVKSVQDAKAATATPTPAPVTFGKRDAPAEPSSLKERLLAKHRAKMEAKGHS